ncbi:MAG: MSCRAMM family adhesin SdrC, partial [Lachnospiraceae bacterium]|nr:MSCRAMM family adhesin SdrC [Lachnospiraceae bacterium]
PPPPPPHSTSPTPPPPLSSSGTRDPDQSTEETPDTDQSTEETPDADQSTEETPDTDQTAEETPDADQSAEETPDTDQSEEVPINPGDEKEEQPSKEELLFTEEEQKQIDAVIALIEALPAPEEVMEKLSALEEEQDEEGFDTYYMEFQQQVLEAYEAYAALTEAQQKAVTNAEKLKQYDWMMSETLEETLWDIMKPDEAYVNEIKVTGTATGSAPFDETEGRGNDTTASDLLVRTFDTVTYHFNVNMKTWDTSKSYGQARVKLEFVLPLNENEAVFEQTAMAWMDQTEGYKPVVTEEIRTIDGIEKECQVLTCYKLLLPSEGNHSVVPGDFGENLTIYVRSMKNGEKFAPIISAAMEGGAWDAPCDKEDHKIDGQPAVEKKTVIPEKVEVTAAPKYNIRVSGDSCYPAEFDFQTGWDDA